METKKVDWNEVEEMEDEIVGEGEEKTIETKNGLENKQNVCPPWLLCWVWFLGRLGESFLVRKTWKVGQYRRIPGCCCCTSANKGHKQRG